ncbi:EXTL2-domain-containing protein [Meredithblackwellia eburnea MCA 4105]
MRLLQLAFALLAAHLVLGSGEEGSKYQGTRKQPPYYKEGDALISINPEEGFTMMLATYKRDELLPKLIKHLTTSPPPSLRHIVIIWQNVGVPLPSFLLPAALDQLSTSGVAVTVRKSKVNSMNERFRPILDWDEEIDTDAVMIMDDDVILRRDVLEWGYEEFRSANPLSSDPNTGRIVGFAGRDFGWSGENGDEVMYDVRPTKSYSMILSNAAWFRKAWLERYWMDDQEMVDLRAYVDKVFNCDDLLINYVVSNITHQPPLLLQPNMPLRTVALRDGLWNRAGAPEDDPSTTSSTPSPSSADSTAPDPIPTDPTTPPVPSRDSSKLDHFSQRTVCLAYYFAHFAKHAPLPSHATKGRSHYPLVRTRTSASQDVTDHARWLMDGESWEAEVWSAAPVSGSVSGAGTPLDGAITTAEEGEMEFDAMLAGMSDEELDALLAQLAEEERRDRVLEERLGELDVGQREEEDVDEEGKVGRNVDEL